MAKFVLLTQEDIKVLEAAHSWLPYDGNTNAAAAANEMLSLINRLKTTEDTSTFWLQEAEKAEKGGSVAVEAAALYGYEPAGYAWRDSAKSDGQLAKLYRHLASVNAPIPDWMKPAG